MEHLFSQDPILKTNIIGICSDGASNMKSILNKGLYNRLKEDITHLVHIKDLCHCYNIVCEQALKEFPVYIISFIRKVCSYFNIGQRSSRLKEVQIQAGEKEPVKILRYIEDRWSSLLHCAERILRLWKSLQLYFEEAESTLKTEINDPEYELYIYLLVILLHKTVGYIVLFQKSDLLWDCVYEKMKESFTLFSRFLLKEPY